MSGTLGDAIMSRPLRCSEVPPLSQNDLLPRPPLPLRAVLLPEFPGT